MIKLEIQPFATPLKQIKSQLSSSANQIKQLLHFDLREIRREPFQAQTLNYELLYRVSFLTYAQVLYECLSCQSSGWQNGWSLQTLDSKVGRRRIAGAFYGCSQRLCLGNQQVILTPVTERHLLNRAESSGLLPSGSSMDQDHEGRSHLILQNIQNLLHSWSIYQRSLKLLSHVLLWLDKTHLLVQGSSIFLR